MQLWLIFILLFVGYFVVYRIIFMMYYRFIYYKLQGIPSIGFPLPILGNSLKILKSFYDRDEFSRGINVDIYDRAFKGQRKVPPIFIEFTIWSGNLIFADPVLVHELYGNKNKYYDKHPKVLRCFQRFLYDESMVFQQTTPSWHQKRKLVGEAFFKNKLGNMLTGIQACFVKTAQEHMNVEGVVDLGDVMNRVVSACATYSVFGLHSEKKPVKFEYFDGRIEELPPGVFLKKIAGQITYRLSRPWRFWSDLLDDVFIGKYENILLRNVHTFHEFVREQFRERRELIKDDNFRNNNHDFLTLLLQIEEFKDKPEIVESLCIGFLFGSTQSSTTLMVNGLCYQAIDPSLREKLRKEIRQHVDPCSYEMTAQEWADRLDHQKLLKMEYLTWYILEVLRLDPPFQMASPCEFLENITVGKYKMLTGHFSQISIYHLHHNPDEWQEAESFIPERFDLNSKWFPTPKGTKRHPMSFCPFTGGRRVCLGRALGEQMGKMLLAQIVTNYDIDLVEEKHRQNKPNFDLTLDNPPIPATIRKRTKE